MHNDLLKLIAINNLNLNLNLNLNYSVEKKLTCIDTYVFTTFQHLDRRLYILFAKNAVNFYNANICKSTRTDKSDR